MNLQEVRNLVLTSAVVQNMVHTSVAIHSTTTGGINGRLCGGGKWLQTLRMHGRRGGGGIHKRFL